MERHMQKEIFQAMERPDFYPHPVTQIQKRETHISKVFLTGDYVYKIKKAVDLQFLDYTTLEKRRHFCHQEVKLNRRLTQNIYLNVVPITERGNRHYLSGPGKPVEYAVKMRQLPDDCSLVNRLRKRKIGNDELVQLSEVLAEFYSHAASNISIRSVGSWETVWANCEENFDQTEKFAGKIIEDRKFQIIRSATRTFLQKWKALFLKRMAMNKIRDCHGDLRAGHIYFSDGIQIIDCIEFNERFRYSDVTADLAFLAMDLEYEGYPETAHRLLDLYARRSNDKEIFVLIDFYTCYRAFVRAKVNCFHLLQDNLEEYKRNKLLRETRKYMELAYTYALKFSRPTLWIICGMMAAGKSTIANELAKTLNVEVYQSDVIRKQLFGLDPHTTLDMPYAQGIYSQNANALTYGKLLMLAQEKIKKGCSVILDATFSNHHHREEAVRLAKNSDANHIFVECIAPNDLIKMRLLQRKSEEALSDARLHHFEKHKGDFEPLAEVENGFHIRVNTEQPLEKNMQQILSQSYCAFGKEQNARSVLKLAAYS